MGTALRVGGIVAATDVAKYGGLAWVFVVGFLLGAVDLIYFWMTGAYTARTRIGTSPAECRICGVDLVAAV